jgi:magnesium transporter
MTTELDVCGQFAAAHPADAARALEALPPSDVAPLFEADVHLAATVLPAMVPTQAADSLAAMPAPAAAGVVLLLRTDVAVDLLRRMHADARQAVLDALPPDAARPFGTLLRQAAGSAGALLDPRALALSETLTAGEAARRVRRSAGDLLSYIYVVDDGHRLTGVLDVRELLTARPEAPLSSVMRTAVVRIRAGADRDAILSHPGWRSFHALPVVDDNGVLLGALRYHTLRRLEEERAGQDPAGDPVLTARALGELYLIGVAGLLEGLVATVGVGPAARAEAPRAEGGS